VAQPNEPADAAIHGLGQQGIEFSPHPGIEALDDAGLDPAFGGNKRVSTKPFNNRHPWQDGQGASALPNESACQILVGTRGF